MWLSGGRGSIPGKRQHKDLKVECAWHVLGIARRPLWLGESAWGKGARDHVTEVRGRVEVDLPGSGRPWEGLHLWGATGEL